MIHRDSNVRILKMSLSEIDSLLEFNEIEKMLVRLEFNNNE